MQIEFYKDYYPLSIGTELIQGYIAQAIRRSRESASLLGWVQ